MRTGVRTLLAARRACSPSRCLRRRRRRAARALRLVAGPVTRRHAISRSRASSRARARAWRSTSSTCARSGCHDRDECQPAQPDLVGDGKQLAYASGGVLRVSEARRHRQASLRRPDRRPSRLPGGRTPRSSAYLTTHGSQNTDLWVAARSGRET